MRVTMDDVARRAGVSRSTVSVVLSGRPGAISAKTRERVLAAARELGYLPNRLRRAMQTGRMDALGVVFANQLRPGVYPGGRASEVLLPATIGGILAGGADAGVSITFFAEHGAAQPSGDALADRRVDGVLLVAPAPQTDLPRRLAELDVPCVVALARAGDVWVDADHDFGARQAARHLLGLGHRRLALLRPREMTAALELRREAFCQELRELGVAKPAAELALAHGSAAQGTLAELLGARQRPTAIFALNDELAEAALAAAQRAGLAVPEELSVVGFDDSPLATRVEPRLTTVEVPYFALFRRAVGALAALVREEALAEEQQILPTRLVIRDSTAAVR